MRPHISFSELASFATGCQWKWKLDYLEERRSTEYSVHFDFGTSMHAALEAYFRRKKPITLEQASRLFTKKFSWLTSKNGPKYPDKLSVKDYTGFLAAGPVILKFFKDTPELQGAEVLFNEYKLFEDIEREDDVEMKFKGFIDTVFKTKDKRGNTILYIADFKTCSWGWGRDKRDDRWKHYQLFLYKYFFCKKHNIDPKSVRTAFILLKRTPSKGADPVEFFPVSAGPVSVQRALDALGSNVTEMVEREKNDSFLKDLNCCQQYGRSCPYLNTPECPRDS